jgi:hypothetical protein
VIKIVNIKTGAIVAAYRQNVLTEFNRAKYMNAQDAVINSMEKRHNDLMATLSEANRQMEVQARSTLLDLNGFFGALPGTAQEPHGYVMVLTGSHDVYGELIHEC